MQRMDCLCQQMKPLGLTETPVGARTTSTRALIGWSPSQKGEQARGSVMDYLTGCSGGVCGLRCCKSTDRKVANNQHR